MKKTWKVLVLTASMTVFAAAGAGSISAEQKEAVTESALEAVSESVLAGEEESEAEVLEDGIYSAEFHTDSGMFHVNEANDGKGLLTVKEGEMTLHVSLTSKNIVNLFPGLAEEAKQEDAQLLEPTEDTVTYSDGISETVNGFDIPVPALDEEFDLALIGTKGKWYDHKVSVTSPEPIDEETAAILSGKVD